MIASPPQNKQEPVYIEKKGSLLSPRIGKIKPSSRAFHNFINRENGLQCIPGIVRSNKRLFSDYNTANKCPAALSTEYGCHSLLCSISVYSQFSLMTPALGSPGKLLHGSRSSIDFAISEADFADIDVCSRINGDGMWC